MAPREHVVIIGGGIAGLTLAAALDPRRFRVTIVEERPERAGQGTVLALWPGAVRALDTLEDVGARVRAAGHRVDHGTLRDARGRVLARVRTPELLFVPRPALLAALDRVLPADATRRTREVTDPHALARELGADLVVGADGVRSVCRQSAFPGSAPVVTDWIALRGHLDEELAGTCEWWGPGALFGTTPGPRGTAWFCAVRADHDRPGVDLADSLALATGHFGGWDPRLRRILAAGGGSADAQRILLAPLLRRRVDHGLVLIGDAAHGMAPNLARGANEAIRDGTQLAAALHRHGTKGGPAPFARRRHATTQAMRVASSLVLRAATSRRLAPVRDRVLRASARHDDGSACGAD